MYKERKRKGETARTKREKERAHLHEVHLVPARYTQNRRQQSDSVLHRGVDKAANSPPSYMYPSLHVLQLGPRFDSHPHLHTRRRRIRFCRRRRDTADPFFYRCTKKSTTNQLGRAVLCRNGQRADGWARGYPDEGARQSHQLGRANICTPFKSPSAPKCPGPFVCQHATCIRTHGLNGLQPPHTHETTMSY